MIPRIIMLHKYYINIICHKVHAKGLHKEEEKKKIALT